MRRALRRALPAALALAAFAAAPPLAAQAIPDAYDISVVEVRPELLNRSEVAAALAASYPPALRDAGVAGTVMVRILIDAEGLPAKTEIVRSSDAAFDSAAAAVVSLMRFRPAEVEGRKVRVWAVLPIQFEVQARAAEAPAAAPADFVGTGAGRPDATGTYDVRMVDVKPELLNRQEIARTLSRTYPPVLRDAGVSGSVDLRFRIGMDGRPAAVTVVRTTDPGFNAPAIAVAEAMRFSLAKHEGKVVPVWVDVPIQFQVVGSTVRETETTTGTRRAPDPTRSGSRDVRPRSP